MIDLYFSLFYHPLTGFFLAIIKFFHGFTGNYGWDIIILTALIRVALYPLTFSSLKSMKVMQELQPKIKALQKKFKDDREGLNRETLALYRQHGANPISGCLPMLLQIPIFIILFQILRVPAANGYIFVNASFYGMDLTAAAFNRISPDFLGNLALVLPGMVDLSGIGISFFNHSYLYLPTLILVAFMTVTTFMTQQGMKTDQSQAMNFIIMNVFIVLISFTMPSGVLLYWGMSNFFQLAQQKLIFRTKKPAESSEKESLKPPEPASPALLKKDKTTKTQPNMANSQAKNKKQSGKKKKKRKKRK